MRNAPNIELQTLRRQPHLHSTKAVLRRVPGVTKRNLQWWDERAILRPRKCGHARLYSDAQLVEIALLAMFRRECHFQLKACRRLLVLIANLIEPGRGYGYIVTDGKTLKVADNAEWAIKEAVRFQRGVHVIDLADLWKRVRL